MTIPDSNTIDPVENQKDESKILSDQDMTMKEDLTRASTLENVEDDPSDFVSGEIDVKEQMDRTAHAVADSLKGVQNARSKGDRSSELLESFRATPGGLDEVIMKTDEDLARMHGAKKNKKLHS